MNSATNHSTELFSRIFHASPVAFGICTLHEGRFLEVNASFLSLTGFNREEVVAATDRELGLWADPHAREELHQALADRRTVRDMEWRIQSKKGEIRNTLASAELFEVRNQRCVLLIAYDVTDRLSREVQLRQTQKMEAVGQLAAGFAHDFNNILAIVQGYTSLLLAEPGLDGQTNKALKEVSTAAERAANLTRRLLTFSRKQFMQPKTFDLNEVLRGLGSLLQRVLGDKVELKVTYEPQMLLIKADPGMMEQMVINLAANAHDSMPKGGQFSISTTVVDLTDEDVRARPNARAGRFARISLTDTGNGMSPATLNRIFEPFFTTKEVGKGTGLGLSTVYGIVKQHNGWIEVSSQPGQGTTFKIFLPAEKATVPDTSRNAATPVQVNGKERILLVEDEESLRIMVESILTRHGYVVVAASNGVEALQAWRQCHGQIDLLLTDMVMPEGMTGRQLAYELRAQNDGLKVIYTSGYSLDLISDASEEMREGLNFLQKPYHPQLLAETVRTCLDSTVKPSPEEALGFQAE